MIRPRHANYRYASYDAESQLHSAALQWPVELHKLTVHSGTRMRIVDVASLDDFGIDSSSILLVGLHLEKENRSYPDCSPPRSSE